MKRIFVCFVSMMMVLVANAQYDFMFNNVAVSNTTKNVKSVTVEQLAQASARRSASTRTATRRAAATTPAQQTTNMTSMQQELVNQASAGQQVVVTGTIENVYNNGWELLLDVRTTGMYGGVHRYALQGYNLNIEIHRGDLVYFVATYTGNTLPQVSANEFINPTGMRRYMVDCADMYYGGNYALMLSSNGQMSKWQRTLNTIATTAVSVAGIVSLVKALF